MKMTERRTHSILFTAMTDSCYSAASLSILQHQPIHQFHQISTLFSPWACISALSLLFLFFSQQDRSSIVFVSYSKVDTRLPTVASRGGSVGEFYFFFQLERSGIFGFFFIKKDYLVISLLVNEC